MIDVVDSSVSHSVQETPCVNLFRMSGNSTAKIISGTEIAASVRKSLAADIQAIRQGQWPSFAPRLCIVQVGDRTDSNVYIRMKDKAAQEIGIK